MMPQLKIRSEYSFRKCYGSIQRIAEVLQELETPAAGIVDTSGTWSHVQWEKHLKATDVKPMFGAEFTIPTEDGRKPRCWVLAEDLRQFYRLSSTDPKTEAELIEAKGVVRFAGSALESPDSFDFIDITPRSRYATIQALKLREATGKQIVITGDNDYPSQNEYLNFMAWADAEKMTPQHILHEKELRNWFHWLDDDIVDEGIRNTYEVAERCTGLQLNVAPIISVEGDLRAMVEEGRKMRLSRGHIANWTSEYQERLARELSLIRSKKYESYFIVVSDMMKYAKSVTLCGPARGSSAGSLVCYLLEITEVDPIPHQLIFERFIDVNRSDLPDIDVDIADSSRHLVFEYLASKYGEENVARIGSINRLKPRSAIAHAGKKLGIPHGAAFPVVNVLFDYSSGDSRYGYALQDTLDQTKPGQDFVEAYPESSFMAAIEDTASHTGQHAAGEIVCQEPVVEYCTVRDGIAHIDKKDAEYLNLLKIDILGLRTLGIIEDANVISAQGLYDLKLDDTKVFEILNDRKFSGVFQFEGAGQRRVSEQIHVDSFERMDHITALARPGPLASGGTNSYIMRLDGREAITYPHPMMEPYLKDTLGIVTYQEQTMRISREVGQLPWEDVSDIRKAMSGSKGEEYFNRHGTNFVSGAKKQGISEADAQAIWDGIVSFGSWAMNKSHTVSYSIISYWCAWLKTYHPTEYAAACLRHAKDDTQTMEILREFVMEGGEYTPFDPQLSGVDWEVAKGKILGGYKNLVGVGPVKANYYVQKRDGEGLDKTHLERIAKHKVKFDDLCPVHTRYGKVYKDPVAYRVQPPIKEFVDLKDGETATVICRMIRLERRDENETVRVARRGNKRWRGASLFLDTFMVDDSVSSPIRVRVAIRDWHKYGEICADKAVPGDYFLIRGRFLGQFSMMNVKRMYCLTQPDMFGQPLGITRRLEAENAEESEEV